MYYVYGLQAIGQPTGPIKIGYAKKPIDRLNALEPGALGERLQVVFQILAGATKDEAKKLEKVYHFEFAALRMNREQFRFDPRMLTWTPADTRRIYGETGAPPTNVLTVKLELGNTEIFAAPVSDVIPIVPTKILSGDLSMAISIQTVSRRRE